jgi:hypothetical protein
MNMVLMDMEMAERAVKDRMRAAADMAEKERLLGELGYSLRNEIVRLTAIVIALGLLGALLLVML